MNDWYFLVRVVGRGTTYSSCKAIRDSNTAVESGEYTIRTVAGNILDKVCESTVSIKR